MAAWFFRCWRPTARRSRSRPACRPASVEAGHLLGSTSIQLLVADGARRRCVVFSGDLGPRGAPILEDAEGFHQARRRRSWNRPTATRNHPARCRRRSPSSSRSSADAVRRRGKVLNSDLCRGPRAIAALPAGRDVSPQDRAEVSGFRRQPDGHRGIENLRASPRVVRRPTSRPCSGSARWPRIWTR